MLKQLNELAGNILKKEEIRLPNDRRKDKINISLVSDKEIKKLNRTFRKKNKPTDVLSFYFGEDGILGDVIISTETAKRNARIFKVKYSDELRMLAIHGTLHLIGYDHIKKTDRIIMEEKEDFYAKKII